MEIKGRYEVRRTLDCEGSNVILTLYVPWTQSTIAKKDYDELSSEMQGICKSIENEMKEQCGDKYDMIGVSPNSMVKYHNGELFLKAYINVFRTCNTMADTDEIVSPLLAKRGYTEI